MSIKPKYAIIWGNIYMVKPNFKKLENNEWVDDIDMQLRYHRPSFMNFEYIEFEKIDDYIKNKGNI